MSFFNPRSVALVGARESSTWSVNLVANFRDLGYEGELHPVHPRHREQFGLRCTPSLEAIEDPVDHAYVMTGTAAALEVLEACGRKGIRHVTMLTAGFRESGPEGAALEARLATRARELGIGVLGPNCLGFVNYADRVPAYALPLAPPLRAGGVAMLSQSGVMLQHFHRLAQARGVGLAVTVSIGNEAVLDSATLIGQLLDRPDVRVVGALLEGFRDPAGFRSVAERALAAGKPLVVLKVGRGEAAARSVAAHTGSLAGADEVVDAVLRRHGVVRVRGVEELVETCGLLAARGWPADGGGRTAVITTSGGTCGVLSDLAHGTRLELPDFAPATKSRLAEILPVFGTPQNPLDTTGVVVDRPELLAACVRAVAAERSYDALLINSEPPRAPGPSPASTENRLRLLADALREAPVFTALAGSTSGDLSEYGREMLNRHGLHFLGGLEQAVRAVDHAIGYGRARAAFLRRPRAAAAPRRRSKPALAGDWRGTVPERAAKSLLGAYGIGLAAERQVRDPQEAAGAALELGFPVVLKVQSRDLPHKSDAGGVRLGLRTAGEVRAAATEVLESVRARAPEARLEGLLVSRQVEAVAELIAGVTVDAQFGPVLVAGLGGVFTELLRDFSLRLPPIDHEEALAMLRELRAAAVLEGARGRAPADLEACAGVLVSLGELALDLGARLRALEVNPLLALPAGQGAVAVDALLVLE